jgi:hypothetical protein
MLAHGVDAHMKSRANAKQQRKLMHHHREKLPELFFIDHDLTNTIHTNGETK